MITIAENPSPGVNLIGFLDAESGLGEIARKLGRGLEQAGIPFAAIAYRRTPSRQEHPRQLETSGEARYDTNLICLNADELPTLADDIGVELFAGHYTIGLWFWETSVFRREDRRAFVYVDEVWAPSEYVREVVQREADVPVLLAPIPIEPAPPPALPRDQIGLPPGFLFLFLFDFVSSERKNPIAVVDAFTRAFAPGEGPKLVLKSINGRERKPRQLEQLQAAAAGRSDILVLDGYVSAAERDAFVAACDCFISLHRSEGLGLTMAEAMSRGKPVIATGYSGNLEFMDERTGYLVPYDLVPVPEDWWAHAPGAHWADPDVDAAAALLREVYGNQERACEVGDRGRAALLETHSVERAASFISVRYEDVTSRLAQASESAAVRDHLLRAAHVASRGVAYRARERAGRGPLGPVRRLALRALWPHLEERHRFDTEVLDSLLRVQRASQRPRETL